MTKKKRAFDARKEVRAISRERVGPVKASKTIQPKSERKPRYKKNLLREPVDPDSGG